MCKNLVMLLCVMLFVGSVSGAENYFTGGGDGVSYSDPANWSEGVLSTSSDNSYIGGRAEDENADYSVTLDTTALTSQIKIGTPEVVAGSFALNVETGANLDGYRLYLGPFGTLNINDGLFGVDVLAGAGGTINIDSGTLDVDGPNWYVGSPCTVNISGGTMRVHNGTKFSSYSADSLAQPNAYFKGVINLCGGELVFDGDCVNAVAAHVHDADDNGTPEIIAYGGIPGVLITRVYDAGTNTTTVSASCNVWTGAGDGVSWSDAANWSKEATPVYNTNSSEFSYIGVDAESDYNVTIDDIAKGGKFWLGRPEDPEGTYTLNIEEGSDYYLVRMYVGSQGVLNMNGGVFDAWEGKFDDAVVNINGGEFTIRSYAWYVLGDTVMTLNGGTFRIKNGDQNKFSNTSADFSSPSTGFTGVIDIHDGKLVMDGDCRKALQWHIDNGNIIDSTGVENELTMFYDSLLDITSLGVLSAVQNTWPADGMTLIVDDRQTIQLNWKQGAASGRLAGFNVYVCDPNDGGVFELESDAVTPYQGTTWQLSVAPGGTYQWRIDEVVEGTLDIITGDVWTVTIDDELLTVYEQPQDGGNHPLDWQWIGCGDGFDWNDELNWHSEVVGEPIPAYTNMEGFRSASRLANSELRIDYYSVVGNLWIGDGLKQELNVTDQGYLQAYRMYIKQDGTLDIGPRSMVKTVHFMSEGGRVNLEGYLRIVGQYWSFKKPLSSDGLKLLDGYLEVAEIPTSLPFGTEETGNIDLYEGEILVAGDQVATIQDWVDNGYVVAYGDYDGSSTVDVYYDSALDLTIASGRKDPNLAFEPIPADLETAADVNGGLSWVTGDNATGDTLYMTKWCRADLNEDTFVNIDDLLILAGSYLDDSWQAVSAVDVNRDSGVDLADLAYIASEWNSEHALVEIDTFTQDPNTLFSYSVTLDPESKYFWRVDTTSAEGTQTGNLWSFTTATDPMNAYNEYPVHGDNNVVYGSVDLAWEVDDAVDSCNVYFGDSYAAVDLATTSSSEYQTNTAANTWTCSAPTVGKRYYWRIDTVDGATVRKGRVWAFKATDTPMGLYNDGGVLKLNGSQFKGYGVNYINAFTNTLKDHSDTSYEDGFATLGANDIPFARMCGGDFYVIGWDLYFEDKEKYFELLDDVMASAEENNVGVILNLFWKWFLVPDLVGEHVTDWGTNPDSLSNQFVESYVREIYDRYKNCPAFFGWEVGNEYNLSGENTELAPRPLAVLGHPEGTRDTVDDRLTMTLARQIATNFANAVRKVDKNRIISNGFSFNLDSGSYAYPEEQADHAMADVVSVHYYARNGVTSDFLDSVVTTAASWGKTAFVGEFGVSENDSLGFPTTEAAFDDMLSDMNAAGITFAAAWIFEFDDGGAFNITDTNFRAYMLDKLQLANQAMNP